MRTALAILVFLPLLAIGQIEPELLLLSVAAPAAAPATGSSLTNFLTAYWRMDEVTNGTGTTRSDSVGSSHLTDNGSPGFVGFTAGLITNSARFESNNAQYLSVADNDAISVSRGAFTIAFGLKRYYRSNAGRSFEKYSTSLGRELFINGASAGVAISATFYTNTADSASGQSLSLPQMPTNTWNLLVFVVNTNANTLIACSNLTNWVTNASLASPFSGGTAAPLTIGGSAVGYLDGEIDEVGIWNTNLTFTQITNLVNAWSNGVSYPFTGIP